MSATCTAIADALVAALAGATFSMPIAARFRPITCRAIAVSGSSR